LIDAAAKVMRIETSEEEEDPDRPPASSARSVVT
jgi:hypothetical protein